MTEYADLRFFAGLRDFLEADRGSGVVTRSFDERRTVAALIEACGVPPGEVVLYHAWEPYQSKDWKGQQEPVEAPWKPIHLAGDYGQLHYRMFYGAPSHAPRGAPVEVERVA